MKFIRFTTTPTHGTVLELRGQSYEVTSSLVIGYLNRRCPQHHRPGRVATTTSSQRPEEARHGS